MFVLPIATSVPAYAQDDQANTTSATREMTRENESNDVEKSHLIPALEIVGFEFALNRFAYRYVDRESFDVSWSSVRRNLNGPWVVDKDDFETNQFLHPYQGSVYHTAARSAGLDYWTSAVYTFVGSALWEIAGETTPPSRNDQIASGIGGSFFGEPLFRMASLTLERGNGLPRFWRALGATAISPATGFNRFVFGKRFDPVFPGKEPALSTQWNFGTTVAEHRVEGVPDGATGREAVTEVAIAYGLPGKPGYTYHRPFDYFNFEFTATTSNVFENIMTRGLIAGAPYGSGRYHGIWGLFGSYDYMAPQVFRLSSTAVSGGTTAQWKLRRSVTFQGSALLGAGYGAAGANQGVSDRDYHYGVTPQALLSMRWIFGNRASFDLTGRGYEITRIASTDNRGSETVTRGDASVTVRLKGAHAVTVKYLIARRSAHYPDIAGSKQQRGTLSLYYTLVGEKRLNSADPQPAR